LNIHPSHTELAQRGNIPGMTDNKKLKGIQDKVRINVNEAYEVEYWTKKFGISPQQLRGAVRAVGVSVKRVREYLAAKRG
jgi:hypothetical protein